MPPRCQLRSKIGLPGGVRSGHFICCYSVHFLGLIRSVSTMTQASFWRISHIQATSLGTTGQKRLREDGASLNRGLVAAAGEKLACLRWVNTVLGNSKSAIALVTLTGLWMQPALVTARKQPSPSETTLAVGARCALAMASIDCPSCAYATCSRSRLGFPSSLVATATTVCIHYHD